MTAGHVPTHHGYNIYKLGFAVFSRDFLASRRCWTMESCSWGVGSFNAAARSKANCWTRPMVTLNVFWLSSLNSSRCTTVFDPFFPLASSSSDFFSSFSCFLTCQVGETKMNKREYHEGWSRNRIEQNKSLVGGSRFLQCMFTSDPHPSNEKRQLTGLLWYLRGRRGSGLGNRSSCKRTSGRWALWFCWPLIVFILIFKTPDFEEKQYWREKQFL